MSSDMAGQLQALSKTMVITQYRLATDGMREKVNTSLRVFVNMRIKKGGGKMPKFIARVFVPMYLELEADNEAEANKKAESWYKEQKKECLEPTVELIRIP